MESLHQSLWLGWRAIQAVATPGSGGSSGNFSLEYIPLQLSSRGTVLMEGILFLLIFKIKAQFHFKVPSRGRDGPLQWQHVQRHLPAQERLLRRGSSCGRWCCRHGEDAWTHNGQGSARGEAGSGYKLNQIKVNHTPQALCPPVLISEFRSNSTTMRR